MVVIVVVMSVIIYTWSTGVFGAILPPPPNGKETLAIENQAFNSAGNNVTLYLRNTGSAVVTLVSYYVQDLNGNSCAKTTGWTKGPFSPGSLAIVPLAIPAPPSSYCAWSGSPFTFTQGVDYNVVVVTSHSQQFSFTIQR